MTALQHSSFWAHAAFAFLLALPRTGFALRTASSTSYRQLLNNHQAMDLQYTAEIKLGGQTLLAVLDTGSFELLAFGKQCSQLCGDVAKLYDESLSSTFKAGLLSMVHTFGSGDVYTNSGYEQFSVGPYVAPNMTFWEAFQANMPLLMNADFQAIVGMAPPGRPEHDAAVIADQDEERVDQYDRIGVVIPHSVSQQAADSRTIADIRGNETNNVPEALNVSRFSVCYGRETGTHGHFVWKDDAVEKRPELFSTIPVHGDYTWSSTLGSVRLVHPNGTAMNVSLGCDSNCGALVDSGTSLLVLPSQAAASIRAAVSTLGSNCSNFSGSHLPSLSFTLGGQELTLPPEAFLGFVQGVAPSSMQGMLANTRTSCNLDVTVMTSDQETQLGPLWILGMPFMRQFYTTFDLGPLNDTHSTTPPPVGTRKMYTALPDPGCYPTTSDASPSSAELQLHKRLKTVDAAHVRVSNWVGKATSKPQGRVRL